MYNQYTNPYMNYGRIEQQYPQQPIYQTIPIQQSQPTQSIKTQSNLQGKMVESIEIAKNVEATLDGSTIYMPLLDGSAIVTKKLTNSGTSEITIFKPILDEKKKDNIITLEDIKNSIDNIKNYDYSDVLDGIEDLRKQIKELKGKNK